MRQSIRRTWLPTLLFALPMFIFELISRGAPSPPVGTRTITALVIVPLIWWLTGGTRGSIDRGHWAARGALCAALFILIPTSYYLIVGVMRGSGNGSGGLATIGAVVSLAFLLALLVPVGAAIGALAAFLLVRSAAKGSGIAAQPDHERSP